MLVSDVNTPGFSIIPKDAIVVGELGVKDFELIPFEGKILRHDKKGFVNYYVIEFTKRSLCHKEYIIFYGNLLYQLQYTMKKDKLSY